MSKEKLKITLYSTDNALRSAIREAFDGVAYEVLEVTDSAKMARSGVNEQQQSGAFGRLSLPDHVDYVVSRSSLNMKTEWLAASLGTHPVIIPEALDWLRGKLAKKGELILVGADQGR
jgi:hypothetical protein